MFRPQGSHRLLGGHPSYYYDGGRVGTISLCMEFIDFEFF
jgi:hypothetical protein